MTQITDMKPQASNGFFVITLRACFADETTSANPLTDMVDILTPITQVLQFKKVNVGPGSGSLNRPVLISAASQSLLFLQSAGL